MGREGEAPAAPPALSQEQAEAAHPKAAAAPPVTHPGATQPCPICAGTSFRWGWLESGLYGAGKGPAAAKEPRYVRQKTRFGEFIGLRARLCEGCGHVQIFAWEERQGQSEARPGQP